MGGHITLHGRLYDLPCEAIEYYRKKRETYRLACTNVQTKKGKHKGDQTLSGATVQQTSDHIAHTTRVDFRRASSPIKGQKNGEMLFMQTTSRRNKNQRNRHSQQNGHAFEYFLFNVRIQFVPFGYRRKNAHGNDFIAQRAQVFIALV